VAASQHQIRMGRLDTVSSCRTELAKMVRAARRGDMPVDHLTKFASAIRTIAELLLFERGVENRIDNLEAMAKMRTSGIPQREITKLVKAA